MAIKYIYYEAAIPAASLNATDVRWFSESFTTDGGFTSATLELYGKRQSTPGDLTVRLYAADAAHKPTGPVLATGTFDADTLDDTIPDWFSLAFVYAFAADTEYCLMGFCAGGDAANYVYTYGDNTSGYAGYRGESVNSGVAWVTSGTHDINFRIYGAPTVTPPASSQYYTKRLVAAASNELWYGVDEVPTQLVASIGRLDTSDFLSMFAAYGKVFIFNNTILKVVDFTNIKIGTADLNTYAPDFSTLLTGGTSGAKMVVDYITSTTADAACTIYGKRTTAATFVAGETVTGTDDDGNAITFVLSADEVSPDPPHWYDYTVYGGDNTYGAMPTQATIGCNWRGRNVLSGDKDHPFQWYMTRQRNPWDRNYISNDAGAPIEGGNAEAGECGDIIVALISYSRDYLVFGCANSLWVAAGDPAENGALYEFYSTGGILSSTAWCRDKGQNLYLLTTAGLLRIAPGFGTVENLMEESWPDFVKDLAYDSTLHKLVMGYDRQRHGIKIARTTLASGDSACFWYDLRTGAMFPDTYANAGGIFSMFYYEADDPDYRKLLFGCNDGYIRFADDSAKDDDIGDTDQAIDSYVTLGPLALNTVDKEGSLNSMNIITVGGLTGGSESDSNDVDFKVWTGLSADEVTEKLITNAAPQIGGTVAAPGRRRGSTIRRKVRGQFLGLRIGNDTAAQTWGLEKVVLNTKKGGKIK